MPAAVSIHRLAPLLVALALGACAGDAAAPARNGPDAEAARAILRRASPAATDSAFRRLASVPYRAEVRVREGESQPRAFTVSGAAANGSGPDLTNPVRSLLPGEPPHLDPRSADLYRVRLLPEIDHRGRALAGAEAVLIDTSGGESIRRVRSWVDGGTGAPYAVEVWRTSTSAIFDETSRAGVFFGGGEEPLPRAATSDSRITVPFGAPRRVRMDVDIAPQR